MSKLNKLLNLGDGSEPTVVENDSFLFLWCCDCDLKHVIFTRIERGKKPEDDKAVLYFGRDDWATTAMKELKKVAKNKKKGKKK